VNFWLLQQTVFGVASTNIFWCRFNKQFLVSFQQTVFGVASTNSFWCRFNKRLFLGDASTNDQILV